MITFVGLIFAASFVLIVCRGHDDVALHDRLLSDHSVKFFELRFIRKTLVYEFGRDSCAVVLSLQLIDFMGQRVLIYIQNPFHLLMLDWAAVSIKH